jgi:hypothetical protein
MFTLEPEAAGPSRPQLTVAHAPHNDLPDTDADDIGDAWVTVFFGDGGADPSADPDLDGYNNLAEYIAGTDPLTPDAPIIGISLNNTNVSLTCNIAAATPGIYLNRTRTFTIETSTNLLSHTWNPLYGATDIPAGSIITHLVSVTNQSSFYQLKIKLNSLNN